MITFIAIAGGAVLLIGFVAIMYFATQHSKSDESGRAEVEQSGRTTPARTEGRGD